MLKAYLRALSPKRDKQSSSKTCFMLVACVYSISTHINTYAPVQGEISTKLEATHDAFDSQAEHDSGPMQRVPQVE